ncbi:alpha-centractin-like [Onthophagus taurus]|uniref:alpha-centractin-like n=1 Tax=Onthophagus taurus TaxID=166361 RepID=UPI000C20AFDB|nr:alpha-centractin-like [Onthophagus taurus]
MEGHKPVVIDNGSGIIKAGFASDSSPKTVILNSVGRLKIGDPKKDIVIGPNNELNKLSITYPMGHGVIENWDDMEKVWNYIYDKNQLSAFPEEHALLLTETAFNPRSNRDKILEIFYEKYKVPALTISLQGILSLYSTGRTTGIVLDVGDTVSHVLPICKGFAMPFGVKRMDIGGRDITKYLKLLLKKEGVNFTTSSELEIIKNIKETICYISENPINEEEVIKLDRVIYKLPDGKNISVGTSRIRAPETLFTPSLIGVEYSGIHEMLNESIQNCDLDLRRILTQNIVISGGSTLFKGFGKRLFIEMKNLCPQDVQIKINSPKERLYSAWIGGSILASMSTFKDLCVTREEYEENGKYFFNKKHSAALLDQYYNNIKA